MAKASYLGWNRGDPLLKKLNPAQKEEWLQEQRNKRPVPINAERWRGRFGGPGMSPEARAIYDEAPRGEGSDPAPMPTGPKTPPPVAMPSYPRPESADANMVKSSYPYLKYQIVGGGIVDAEQLKRLKGMTPEQKQAWLDSRRDKRPSPQNALDLGPLKMDPMAWNIYRENELDRSSGKTVGERTGEVLGGAARGVTDAIEATGDIASDIAAGAKSEFTGKPLPIKKKTATGDVTIDATNAPTSPWAENARVASTTPQGTMSASRDSIFDAAANEATSAMRGGLGYTVPTNNMNRAGSYLGVGGKASASPELNALAGEQFDETGKPVTRGIDFQGKDFGGTAQAVSDYQAPTMTAGDREIARNARDARAAAASQKWKDAGMGSYLGPTAEGADRVADFRARATENARSKGMQERFDRQAALGEREKDRGLARDVAGAQMEADVAKFTSGERAAVIKMQGDFAMADARGKNDMRTAVFKSVMENTADVNKAFEAVKQLEQQGAAAAGGEQAGGEGGATGDANGNGIPDADEQAMAQAKDPEWKKANPLKAKQIETIMRKKYPDIYA